MDEAQQVTLWLAAFRYYCGRQTYAVSDFCDLLIQEWPKLPEPTRKLIQRDLEEEFERDDQIRRTISDRMVCPLGSGCDRRQWERVRALWREAA